MKKFLLNLSTQRRYWVMLILIGAVLEGAALYYQYVLDEWPCVLCIHVRIWVAAFMLLALVAIFCTSSIIATRIAHFLNVGIMIGFLERSWRVLAIERGWIFGDCDMELGMPAWFALDKWMPSLFEVQTSCGYTPLIIFDISMAELLVVISALMLTMSAAVFIASWFD
ncbi:MAG: disulfide bond formation protein B [Gammaproteobacteria bacterium]|nr:disulfide bond formation protein B [Gammaproteobacteria bacterium]MBT8436057.1 disulfide bond formation protein B [Gammaproteobacteria bacterium]